MSSLTLEDGIKIQQEQLRRWMTVLSARAYIELAEECKWRNEHLDTKTSTGYDVFRGTDLDNYIGNLAYRLERELPSE